MPSTQATAKPEILSAPPQPQRRILQAPPKPMAQLSTPQSPTPQQRQQQVQQQQAALLQQRQNVATQPVQQQGQQFLNFQQQQQIVSFRLNTKFTPRNRFEIKLNAVVMLTLFF